MSDYSACVVVKGSFRDQWICKTGFPTLKDADDATNLLYKEVYYDTKAKNPGMEPRIHTLLVPHYTPLGKYLLPLTLRRDSIPSVRTFNHNKH